MNLQISPNQWSCLLVSFAMVLEEPYQKLIEELGHDGSNKIFPDLEEPYCRRAFHLQELIDCCIRRNKFPVCIDAIPILAAPGPRYYTLGGTETRLVRYLENYNGVLIGEARRPHAVAWNREKCYDPNGTIYDLKGGNFNIREFVLVRD